MDQVFQPLPTSSFIDSNQPAARLGPLTTATNKGRGVLKSKDGIVKGKKGTTKAKTNKTYGGSNLTSGN